MDRMRLPALVLVALLAGCGSATPAAVPPVGGSADPASARPSDTLPTTPPPGAARSTSPAGPGSSPTEPAASLPTRDVAPIAVIDTGLHEKPGDLAGFVTSITMAGGAIWLGSPAGLVRVDPDTNTAEVIDTDAGANISGAGNEVWRTAFYFNTVRRYDARTGKQTLSIDLPGALGVLATPSAVWATEHNDGGIVALDRRTGRTKIIQALASPGSAGPGAVVSAAHALWVVIPREKSVVKIDPATGAVLRTIVLDVHPAEHLSVAGGALWATAVDWEGESPFAPGTLIRIDPVTGQATTSIVPEHHGEVADVEGEPWLPVGDTLVLLDRASGRPLRAVRMGLDGYDAMVARTAMAGVWVASQDDPRLIRLAPSDLRPVGG